MLTYIAQRLALLPVVMLGVTLLTFVCLNLVPGDAAEQLAGKMQDPATIARLRAEWGLDRPLGERFAAFVTQVVLKGDFGHNPATGRPVRDELWQYFAATMQLTLLAMALALWLGLKLGKAAAKHPRGVAGVASLSVAYGGLSVPIFWLGLMASSLFAGALHWLPSSNAVDPELVFPTPTGFSLIDTLLAWIDTGRSDAFVSAALHLVLPTCVLATVPLAIVVRLCRATLVEELSRDYIRTARAKGLTEAAIVDRHAMPNAWVPVLTTASAQFGYLLSGAVLTETVFGWPGVGRYVVEAVRTENTPALLGGTVVLAGVFVIVNLLTDIAYAVLDPRIRLSGRATAASDT